VTFELAPNYGLVGAWLIEAIVDDDGPAEPAFELFAVEGGYRDAGGIAFDDVEIGEALSRELFGNVIELGLWIAVGYVVLSVLRRDTHARAFCAHCGFGS